MSLLNVAHINNDFNVTSFDDFFYWWFINISDVDAFTSVTDVNYIYTFVDIVSFLLYVIFLLLVIFLPLLQFFFCIL